jgi:hypothetical protein
MTSPTMLRRSIAALLAAGPLGGCHYYVGGRPSTLMDRAAFDLACPKEQLKSQQLGDERTMGVSGCGRRATYVYDHGRDNWFLNGTASDGEAEAPTQATAKPISSTTPESGSSGGMTTP